MIFYRVIACHPEILQVTQRILRKSWRMLSEWQSFVCDTYHIFSCHSTLVQTCHMPHASGTNVL